jgi:hypothetical protein
MASRHYNRWPFPIPSALSLLALLASLLAQHAYPVKGSQPLMAFYGRAVHFSGEAAERRVAIPASSRGSCSWRRCWCRWRCSRTRGGDPSGAALALDTVVLYATLRFLSIATHLSAIGKALRDGDVAAAANRLSLWQAELVETDDPGTPRLAAERCARRTTASRPVPRAARPAGPGAVSAALRAARS